MERSITIKITGKEYPLKVATPETEQLMRVAAEAVNKKIALYDAKYPNTDLVDKLAFVTINEAAARLVAQRKLSKLEADEKSLFELTHSYLDSIENK